MNDTKTKVIRAGFLLADPDMERKSGQSVLIEAERIKAVSGRFIDPPPGGELIYLRKKFVLPGLIDCHVHGAARPRIPIAHSRRFRSQGRFQCGSQRGSHAGRQVHHRARRRRR